MRNHQRIKQSLNKSDNDADTLMLGLLDKILCHNVCLLQSTSHRNNLYAYSASGE